MIEMKNFNKKIGNLEIKNMSFLIKKNSFHILLGVNGSGKTTILKAILGYFDIYKGTIKINNINIQNFKSKINVGYVPENPVFPDNIKIIKYLTYMGYIGGLSMEESKKRSIKYLKKYKLSQYAKSYIKSLSTGERKKIMLIQALINNPKILIMDEPTSNFDPIATKNFYEQLLSLNKNGLTILIATHQLQEIEKYADSLTLINNGKILYTGNIKLFKKNKNLLDTFTSIVEKDNNHG